MAREFNNPFTRAFDMARSQTRPAPYIPPEIQEAIDLRKDANDSRSSATDQYESDVADFKNNLATEKEKGIASLPQAPVMTPRREEPIFTPPSVFREEPIFTPPPRFDDIGTPGGPDFNGNINFPGAGTNPFDNIFTPTPTDPVDPGFGGDGTFPNIDFPGLDQDALDELLEKLRRKGIIDDERDYGDGKEPRPPGNGGDYRGPYDPPYVPPEDIILPPPPPPPPSGPINPYTGEAMRNPYTPYEQPSNESNFNRAQMMDPRRFGQAPGFEPPRNPILTPIKLPPGDGRRPPKPPQVPPPDDRLFPEKAKGMNMGGGISQLPMQGQGDTLTTQVFQAGFRPRR